VDAVELKCCSLLLDNEDAQLDGDRRRRDMWATFTNSRWPHVVLACFYDKWVSL